MTSRLALLASFGLLAALDAAPGARAANAISITDIAPRIVGRGDDVRLTGDFAALAGHGASVVAVDAGTGRRTRLAVREFTEGTIVARAPRLARRGTARPFSIRVSSRDGDVAAVTAPGSVSLADPSILDVQPELARSGGEALLTVESLGRGPYTVWMGPHRIPRRSVREEAAPDGTPAVSAFGAPRKALRVLLPTSANEGTYAFKVRTRAGEAVAAKPTDFVQCTILPEPFVMLPLGDKVFLTATLRGPGGTHRELSTKYAASIDTTFPGTIEIQGCGEPDDADACRRTLYVTIVYDPEATTLGRAGVLQASFQDATGGWSGASGTCEITKSTSGRIGGYFTATVEGDDPPRFTIEGSFVIGRP